jgi:hypothetical protein
MHLHLHVTQPADQILAFAGCATLVAAVILPLHRWQGRTFLFVAGVVLIAVSAFV